MSAQLLRSNWPTSDWGLNTSHKGAAVIHIHNLQINQIILYLKKTPKPFWGPGCQYKLKKRLKKTGCREQVDAFSGEFWGLLGDITGWSINSTFKDIWCVMSTHFKVFVCHLMQFSLLCFCCEEKPNQQHRLVETPWNVKVRWLASDDGVRIRVRVSQMCSDSLWNAFRNWCVIHVPLGDTRRRSIG